MTSGHLTVSYATVKGGYADRAGRLAPRVGARRSSIAVATALVFASVPPAHADSPPTPGIKINDETSFCTSAFTAQGNDGNYYLITSAHCDAHDGSVWTYGDNQAPLGKIAKGEYEENPDTGTQTKDAALIKLEPGVGVPSDDIAGKYPVRDALSLAQLKVGTQMCKVGAVTGETCAPTRTSKAITWWKPTCTAWAATAAAPAS